MLTHAYTRIHTRKFDVLQTRLMYSFKKKKPNFCRAQPDWGFGFSVRYLRHTHTHTHTHIHSLTHSLTHSPPPFVCVCARACACVCVCVSLSAAPLLPPTGPVDAAALCSTQQQRRRSQGPHWPRGASGRARPGEPKPENTRRKSPGHVAAGAWGCACICVFAEAVGVLKKRKKEKNCTIWWKVSSV
jgi:hypothetical protein